MEESPFQSHSGINELNNIGGILGYYGQRPYFHTQKGADDRLPYELRDIGLVFYKVFESLGLEVDVRTVLDFDELRNEV